MKTSQNFGGEGLMYNVLLFIDDGEIARKPFDIGVSVWFKRKPYKLGGFTG